MLLEVTFFGRSGVWLLGVLAAGAAVARSLIPAPAERNPKMWMEKVVENTHYFPPEWRRHTHTMAVFSEFSQLFQLKILTFLSEIGSVLTAPYILLFSLPKSSRTKLLRN
jgi:autophagy-related protein 9